LTDQHIIFKNSKTGKVEQITASDLDIVNWQRLIGTWGIRIFLKNGTLHRFGGFKEGVSMFILELCLCVRFVGGTGNSSERMGIGMMDCF